MARAPIPFARGAGKPVKLNMNFMDNITSGALLQLGHTRIGEFSKEVVRWGNGTASLGRSLFYFVEGGSNEGAGRFSAGMASQVQDWVQQAIVFPSARKKNVAAGFFGPARRDEEYVAWLDKIGKGRQPTMYLMGNLAAAFTVLRGDAGGHTLGIKKGFKVQRPVVNSYPIRYHSQPVEVGDYAAAVETGIGMPARPIMTGAIVGWLEKALPEWAISLRKYMYKVYGAGLDHHDHTGINPLDMTVSGENISYILDIVSSTEGLSPLHGRITSPVAAAEHKERNAIKIKKLAEEMDKRGDDMSKWEMDTALAAVAGACKAIGVDSKDVNKYQIAVLRGEPITTGLAGKISIGKKSG